MKRALALLPWVLSLVSIGSAVWSARERGVAHERAASLVALTDSLQGQLDEAEIDRYQLEREREFNDNYLKNLFASQEEAKRAYEMQKVASDEAIAQGAEAIRQSKAKDAALQGEQAARTEEQQQRRLAEARADSIDAQQRVTARANLRLEASKVAQNSMALKGDQRVRGLMAVYAAETMGRSGGDANKEEVVRALQGALVELERSAPPGISRLSAGPQALRMVGAELRALGNDGILIGIDPGAWRKRTIADLSQRSGRSGGHAFLGDGVVLTANLEQGIALSSASDGSLIASEDRTPHTEEIVSMQAFPGGTGLASGDRDGRMVVWAVEGQRLRKVQEHIVGGNARAMVMDARSGTVVAVNGSEKVFILSKDGTLATVSLSDADRASCITNGAGGEVLIGSHLGSVFVLRLADRELRRIHTGIVQRVEAITAGADEGRLVAFVDGVRKLTVFDRKDGGASLFQSVLTGIPNAMAFGSTDVVYLAFADLTVRREFTNGRAMAERVCALINKSWTAEEWSKHIGGGPPQPTCANAR